MSLLLACWGWAALVSLGSFAAAALACDGRIRGSSWIRLGLGLVVLLGPAGTLLVWWLLAGVLADVRSERRRRLANRSRVPVARVRAAQT